MRNISGKQNPFHRSRTSPAMCEDPYKKHNFVLFLTVNLLHRMPRKTTSWTKSADLQRSLESLCKLIKSYLRLIFHKIYLSHLDTSYKSCQLHWTETKARGTYCNVELQRGFSQAVS